MGVVELNNALSSWFCRLKQIPCLIETHKLTDDNLSTAAYVIYFSRYLDDWGELSCGFSRFLSLHKTPDFTSDREGFENLYIIIPEVDDVYAFLPLSDEYDVIRQSDLRFGIQEVKQKIVITYERDNLPCLSKSTAKEWSDCDFDLEEEFPNSIRLK